MTPPTAAAVANSFPFTNQMPPRASLPQATALNSFPLGNTPQNQQSGQMTHVESNSQSNISNSQQSNHFNPAFPQPLPNNNSNNKNMNQQFFQMPPPNAQQHQQQPFFNTNDMNSNATQFPNPSLQQHPTLNAPPAAHQPNHLSHPSNFNSQGQPPLNSPMTNGLSNDNNPYMTHQHLPPKSSSFQSNSQGQWPIDPNFQQHNTSAFSKDSMNSFESHNSQNMRESHGGSNLIPTQHHNNNPQHSGAKVGRFQSGDNRVGKSKTLYLLL